MNATPLVLPQVENSKRKDHPSLFFILVAAAIGVAISAILLPAWIPGLTNSIVAGNVYWYLSRATAIIAYLMLWLTMLWGLLLTGKIAQTWPGARITNEVHKFVSIFGLAMGAFHGLLLLGDKYLSMPLSQILLPFSVAGYRPTWVGFGQISLYLWGLVVLSFYLRKIISGKGWRWVHFISFLTFAGILVHGITSGTDTSTPWMTIIYWITGGSILFLTFYRMLHARELRRAKLVKQQSHVIDQNRF